MLEIDPKNILLYLNNRDIEIRRSGIHGVGLFAKNKIPEGLELGPAFIHHSLTEAYAAYLGPQYNTSIKPKYAQTTATRYINHHLTPNMQTYKKVGQDHFIFMRAVTDINADEEITINYLRIIELAELDEKYIPAFLFKDKN